MNPNIIEEIKDLHRSLKQKDLITVDAGNSFCKKAVFKKGALSQIERVQTREVELLGNSPNDHIICSVNENLQSTFSWEDESFLGAPIRYARTLGHDRLVCAAYLFQIAKKLAKPILLVDCGTFLTIDLIDEQGHQGGFILPGPETFLKSYNHGALLPRLSSVGHLPQDPWPKSTHAAILDSAQLYLSTIVKEIDLRSKNTQASVLLTGGASDLLAHHFPSEQKIEIFPELIHYSLYFTHCKIANP